ncbi:hypothetical protein ACIHCQ_32795 [Streptomyces sp. NPDC052236]|uniref:hypothetical protein n=1 Tax=Streptomyces sp. NPDC052236 TaxID=3365686 RepID=UPI0037D30900
MAFSADELRVLRRALAIALHPVPLAAPLADEEVQDCLRLVDSVDEAVREAGRLRAFLHADLARYRAALPGTAAGYLELLQDALAAGYDPRPEDLAALRTLRALPAGAAVLRRCQTLTEQSVRARLAGHSLAEPPPVAIPAPIPAPARATATVPAPARTSAHARARLLALPGGRAAEGPKPQPKPPAPAERPVPKPSEVFPPRRRPVPPPERLAAG